MPQHEHVDAEPARRRARPPRSAEPPTDHRLLELQQRAGNQAVTHLSGVQRHSLDPEEEGGG